MSQVPSSYDRGMVLETENVQEDIQTTTQMKNDGRVIQDFGGFGKSLETQKVMQPGDAPTIQPTKSPHASNGEIFFFFSFFFNLQQKEYKAFRKHFPYFF